MVNLFSISVCFKWLWIILGSDDFLSLSLFLVFSLSVCRLPADIDVNALLIFFGVFCVIIRLCMHGLIGYWLDAFFFNTLIEIWQECIIGVNINIFCYNFLYTRINTNHDSLHACGRFFFPLLLKESCGFFFIIILQFCTVLQSLYTNVGKVNDRCQVHSSQLSLDGILRTRNWHAKIDIIFILRLHFPSTK